MAGNSREREALNQARSRLMRCANVVATGIGYKETAGKSTGTLAVVCSVVRKLPAARLAQGDLVPASIRNIPTDVVETGVIRAFQERTERLRPAPGGVSIGHRAITAGTLGCVVRKGGQSFILSNNHVLANSNEAGAGDAIVQPGPIDGGMLPGDRIAELSEFVPIEFQGGPSDCSFARGVIALLNGGCRLIGSRTRYHIARIQQQDNLVDAAIARPVNAADLDREILEIGQIAGQGRAELGMEVMKSGRTTGFTTGRILQVDVTAEVQYGQGRSARFTDQVLAGPMSQGGDSGSAVLDNDRRLVGLLFAGSDSVTIVNRIEHVFSALGIGL